MSKPTISIMHDTRRAVKGGLYPVRVQIIFRVVEGDQVKWVPKYLGKDNYCSKADFAGYSKPRGVEMRALKDRIEIIYKKAALIIKDYREEEDLTPDVFFGIYEGKARDTVNAVYAMKITELSGKADQVGTAWAYESSLQSLMRYKLHLEYKRTKHTAEDTEKKWVKLRIEDPVFALRFPEITSDWLIGYNDWMFEEGRTVNTVGIYLRSLRHVFNLARGEVPGKRKIHIIPHSLYPFDDYQIRSEEKYKIALSAAELPLLRDFKDKDDELMEARDYWMFSFYNNGMNFADMAKLRRGDLLDEVMLYDRKKVRNTRRNLKQIFIPIDQETPDIIKRRGTKSLDPNGYVFPILEEGMTELQVKLCVNKFLKKINPALKRIAQKLGIKKPLTTVIARHTWANYMLNATEGDSRMIQAGLGHSSHKTSEHYKGTLYLEKIKKVRKEAFGSTAAK